MKIFKMFFVFLGLFSAANAADITIYYSPTCPHCHHARDFIKNELIYEYDSLKVTEVNATVEEARQDFIDALQKCNYTNGGVPVLVIGEKCFQGYGDGLQGDIRAAIEIDLSDAQKKAASDNREELKKNRDAFISSHESRKNAISDKGNDVKKN